MTSPLATPRAPNRLLPPWLVTVLGGIVVISYGRVGPDWPAQEFRSWFARNVGLRAWNDAWYAGHSLPSYSVLYPPVSAVLGAGLTGLVAAVLFVWATTRLMTERRSRALEFSGPALLVAQIALAICVLGSLLIGQVPFLFGIAAGALAILATRSGHPRYSVIAAATCSLASPLAGLFLFCISLAWFTAVDRRRALPLAASVVGVSAAYLIGGSTGPFPFDAISVASLTMFVTAVFLLVPRELRIIRRSVGVGALAALPLALVPNAVGGNLVRLPQLLALPLAILLLGYRNRSRSGWDRYRPLALILSAIAAAVWFAFPVVSAVARSSGDPSNNASYYSGLLNFLSTQDPAHGRLEIPFTREHWETSFVAPHFPIARGWERQLDVKYNEVLYHPLSADSYRTWLDSSAVSLVALPRVPIDYGGVAERALLADPPSYLHVIYRDANWTVFRVDASAPLLTGSHATLTALGISSFTVHFDQAGEATMKIHADRLWVTNSPDVCLDPRPDGWIHLVAPRAETVTVSAKLTIESVLQQTPSACDNDAP